jgi:hypothetical protein
MFVNLSRRSQGLVERQLKLIDELETGEQDPDQLSNLFKLDHLATRMRRNSENLLVLAGEDAGRRWGRPIPLVDVLRAATSEVEQYHRIQLTGVPDVEVMGHAVNHVVHLVAELLENATVFSSPESKVLVHSQRLSDSGAMIEIEDRGIGMSAQEISDANERLAKPPVFDVSISRMMGLYVVGRLAGRHGITVRLRQADTGGVSAFVRLPVDVLASRFEQRPDQPAGFQDGRPPRPAALPLPAPGAPVGSFAGLDGGPGGQDRDDAPRPLPGPAADLPRRPLPGQPAAGQPGGPVPPGPTPLPRRTPAGGTGDLPMREVASHGGDGQDAPANGALNGALGSRLRPATPVPPNGHPGNGNGNGTGNGTGVPPTLGGATRATFPAAQPPPAQPPTAQFPPAPPAPASLQAGPYGLPAAPPGAYEERTPIFEQLQSEWFRRRPPVRQPAADDGATPADGAAPADGAGPAAAPQPAEQPAALAGDGAAAPQAPAEDPWMSPADEGWRAAERLLQPTSGGTTRAGLPMRVPQAHLVPGGAETPPAPVSPGPPAYRSPEAVRSRLASYHQGVRRGRHADRQADDTGDVPALDQSETLVRSQEQS